MVHQAEMSGRMAPCEVEFLFARGRRREVRTLSAVSVRGGVRMFHLCPVAQGEREEVVPSGEVLMMERVEWKRRVMSERKAGLVAYLKGRMKRAERVEGDGNCAFRAWGLFFGQSHEAVRRVLCDHLASEQGSAALVACQAAGAASDRAATPAEYLSVVRRDKTYVGGEELSTLSVLYGAELRVWFPTMSRPWVVGRRGGEAGKPVVELLWDGVNHYDALVPSSLPVREMPGPLAREGSGGSPSCRRPWAQQGKPNQSRA